jgi:hypothetical protein
VEGNAFLIDSNQDKAEDVLSGITKKWTCSNMLLLYVTNVRIWLFCYEFFFFFPLFQGRIFSLRWERSHLCLKTIVVHLIICLINQSLDQIQHLWPLRVERGSWLLYVLQGYNFNSWIVSFLYPYC